MCIFRATKYPVHDFFSAAFTIGGPPRKILPTPLTINDSTDSAEHMHRRQCSPRARLKSAAGRRRLRHWLSKELPK